MRFWIYPVLLVSILFACETMEEQISNDPSLQLQFSSDTVRFDTLLSERLSLTRRFRVYNPNAKAVKISSIRLGKENQSDYAVIVNGKPGPEIVNEVLFGGDSLLILVSVDIDQQNQNNPYLVKDSVIFDWNGNSEHVKLVSWGQNAHYLRNDVICDMVWTADKPYVIQDIVLIDSLCSLEVEPGTRIFLDNGAGLYVKGTLRILGDSDNRVIIRNTRFDENYLEAPGQWDAIYFLEGSKSNLIQYADIENGSIGLRLGSPDEDDEFDLTIANTSIRHMSNAGILAFSSELNAYNVEVYNTGSFLVGNFAGGTYHYQHCTFSNAPNYFITDEPAVQFSDNLILNNNQTIVQDLFLVMQNCIVWGAGEEELLINNGGGAQVNAILENNIIRSESDIPNNFTSLENEFPGFLDPFEFDYQLDSLSFAIDKGIQLNIDVDLLGATRDENPDIGAYEHKE